MALEERLGEARFEARLRHRPREATAQSISSSERPDRP